MSMEHPHHRSDPRRLVAAVAGALARGEDGGLPMLLHLASSELGAEQVAVFVRDPEREDLTFAGAVGSGSTAPDEATSLAAYRAEPTLGRAIRLDGIEGTAADVPLVVTREGIEMSLGALAVRWPGGRALDEGDAAVLAAFADLVAVALDRGRLATLAEARADHAGRLATIDGLTGLANARTLDRVLELEVERAKRARGVVSIEIFDIDGFGVLNQRAGRDAGDDALREVAAAVAGSVRLVDTVARTGADEFVVVAPGSAGRTVAERIVETVASLTAGSGGVSVSAGIARFPEDGEEATELMAAARAALGTARAAGGGRIAGGDGTAGGEGTAGGGGAGPA